MRTRLYLILLIALLSLSASAHNVVERDGYYEIEHSWKCQGKECSIALNVSTSLYEYYQNEREHLAYSYRFNGEEIEPNYFSFMLSEHDRPVMKALADEFSNHSASELEKINLALTFVQSLLYAYDTDSKGTDEYLRFPVETLVDGCGDCEDKVALLAALLYEMDVDFIILTLPEHMAIGIHCDEVDADGYLLFHGKKYYYSETTMTDWRIGQIPEDYRSMEMEAIPVDEHPSLLIKGVRYESQSSKVDEKANCTLELDLHNLGPGKATKLRVHVWIVENGRRRRVLVKESFRLKDMQEGEQRTETLLFKSLIKENCILEVEVTGAKVASQIYSMEINYNRVCR